MSFANFVLQDVLSTFLRDLNYTTTFDSPQSYVRVSGQDLNNTLEYTFDCGICPEQGSIMPGMEDLFGIGALLFDDAIVVFLADSVCSDVVLQAVVPPLITK